MNIKYNLNDRVYLERLWYSGEMHYNVIATVVGISVDKYGIRYTLSIDVGSKLPYIAYANEGDIKGKVEE